MGPLFQQYQEHNFINHQFMDAPTLKFLQENRPSLIPHQTELDKILPILPKLHDLIKSHTPNISWYLIEEESRTIHGLRHIFRTIAHGVILAVLQNKWDFLTQITVAAALHDVRRKNDLLDYDHAKRAAEWFRSNIAEIQTHFQTKWDLSTQEAIYHAIYFHVIPYDKIQGHPDYIKHRTLVDLLKTADALERYRLPHVNFWIKDDHLRNIPSITHKYLAYQMVILSEEKVLEGLTAFEAVMASIEQLEKNIRRN